MEILLARMRGEGGYFLVLGEKGICCVWGECQIGVGVESSGLSVDREKSDVIIRHTCAIPVVKNL